MQRQKVFSVDRIDFNDGGTLDGSLLTQTLFRLRNAESALANTPGSQGAALQYIDYEPGIPLSTALQNVLVFTTPITVTSTEFSSAPQNTTYRFGNVSSQDVHISDGTTIILSIVPGEFVKFVRLSNSWVGTFGP